MNIIKNQYIKKQIKLLSFIVIVLDIIFYMMLCCLGKYSWSIIWGIILGSGYSILNFIFISVSMERLILVSSEKVKIKAVLGYIIRYLLMGILVFIVMKLNYIISVFSFLVTLFFVKLAIFIQVFLDKTV